MAQSRRAYRLEFYLPANTDAERGVVRDCVRMLRDRYGGATHSSLADQGAFGGEFGEGKEAVRDQVAYVLADTVGRSETRASISQFIDELLDLLRARYAAAGSPQDSVMATVQRVTVYMNSAD